MTRRGAWVLAAFLTISLGALSVAVGATFGMFGFRSVDESPSAAIADRVSSSADDDVRLPWFFSAVLGGEQLEHEEDEEDEREEQEREVLDDDDDGHEDSDD
jgi:hypothetical protein